MRAAPGARLSRVHALALLAALPIATADASAQAPPPGSAPPRHEDLVPSGPSLAERVAEIQQRIQSAVVYPPIARARGEVGEVRVAFEVEPGGQPVGIRVVQSSGSAVLDEAARRAVASAAPFPRLVGGVRVPVRFELSDPDALDAPAPAP